MSKTMSHITAIIATHNRPELLVNRALTSIIHQTRPPNLLIVVDDSDDNIRHANETIMAKLDMPNTKSLYMENNRTRGAAGAWNTALAYTQSIQPDSFVAILDDDDSWDPSYLRAMRESHTGI